MAELTDTCKVLEHRQAPDGSTKYAFELEDGERVESVLFRVSSDDILPSVDALPSPWVEGDTTLCISSQPGCNVGCRFCATGLQPSRRNLTAEEIVAQVDAVRSDLPDIDPKVYFAGMGEPLLNYDGVVAASKSLLASGLAKTISINTIGPPEQVRRLVFEDFELNLYVSLHAATDEVRGSLVPVNRKHPIAPTLAAAELFAEERRRKVRIRYLLLPGINATLEDADRLAELLDPTLFHVQLVIWNAIPGLDFSRIDDEDALRFCLRLHEHGLGAHVIRSKAQSVEAGCGQLATAPPSPARLARAQEASVQGRFSR